MKRAYILNIKDGTVQIGDTVFQPITGESFKVDMKGLRNKERVMVKDKSMASARQALNKCKLI